MNMRATIVLERSRPCCREIYRRIRSVTHKARLLVKRGLGDISKKSLETADRSVDIIARRPGIERPAIHGPAVRVRAEVGWWRAKVAIVSVICADGGNLNRPAALEDEEAERRDKLGLRAVHVLQVGALGAVLEEQRS